VHTIKTERNGTMKTTTRMMTMVVFAVGLLGTITLWLRAITMQKRLKRSEAKFCPLKKPLLKNDEVTGLM
jgi:hypothetical protein